MSNENWTPGPWFPIYEVERINDQNVMIVGDVYVYNETEEHATTVVEAQVMPLANAHLIAAAPDLYEALDLMLMESGGHAHKDNQSPGEAQARTALARARGEQ